MLTCNFFRCQKVTDDNDRCEPQLTITTLMFPDDVMTRFNTGSSLERWSRKCPPLVGGNRKCPSPPLLPDETGGEYDFYSFMEEEPEVAGAQEPETIEHHVVTSDIEELMMQHSERNVARKKRKGKKKVPEDGRRRQKRHKTVKMAISKPPSPGTEQIIRVDVTSNVTSFDSDVDSLTGDVTETSPSNLDDDFVIKCKQLALTKKAR